MKLNEEQEQITATVNTFLHRLLRLEKDAVIPAQDLLYLCTPLSLNIDKALTRVRINPETKDVTLGIVTEDNCGFFNIPQSGKFEVKWLTRAEFDKELSDLKSISRNIH